MKVAMNNTVSSNWWDKPIDYDLSEGEKKLSPNWAGGLPMVTCPDGTEDIANGFLPPCMGKSGNNKPTEEQQRLQIAEELTKQAPETFLQKNKTNLLIAGVLVLGYFAYKKFNK